MDDDELVEELRKESDAEPAPVVRPARTPAAPEKRGPRRWAPIVVVVGLLALVVTGLAFTTDFSTIFVYSRRVDQVVGAPNDYVGREIRVEGELQRGSAQFRHEPCEHRFVLEGAPREGGRREMAVRFPRCVVPDTFRDDMGMTVVVQGRLQSNGTFLADQIIPRCPSKYEMRQRRENGEQMPHALPPMRGQTS